VEGLILLIAVVMLLAVSSVSVVSDTGASLPDTNIPGHKLTTNQTQASNSSASATITITMYAGDAE
jgi:hypothetical protein